LVQQKNSVATPQLDKVNSDRWKLRRMMPFMMFGL